MTATDWLDQWCATATADPENAHIGRFSSFTVLLSETGGATGLVTYDRGVVRVEEVPAGTPADLVLRGPASAWRELADPEAPARRHDLLSLTKAADGLEVVAGREQLLRHLRVLTRLVELAKGHAGEGIGLGDDDPPAGTIVEEVVGRYVQLSSSGQRLRVYFEEAGQGPVLLCLHTAGSDSRQFRDLLNDAELTARYRVVAFDLPWHGRSLPPEGWWTHEYRLTTDSYVALVEDFCGALGLDSPVVLGCSMAGSLVMELARRDPDRWRGVIGLSGGLHVEGRFQDWPLHPDLNAQQVVPAWTSSLMAPQSPELSRREVWWAYAQGGPGIYRGDTYFYSEDLDLRGVAATIDTARCPVHLLTGEYDHACTPELTAEAIAAIPGARGGTMPGIGHFPMAENYPRFRTHLLPVLSEIEDATR